MGSKGRKSPEMDSKVVGILKEYPLETFPNWNITQDRYYVAAPVDKLGEWAFHLRTHLTSLILAGNPAISFLQAFESPALTRLAVIFSSLGFEAFFFSLIVALIWLLDARLGRLLAVLLSLGFMVSGSLKVALCMPRPPAPPAKRLSEENRDWAWPSNHALMGTAYPWFIWMYASRHYDLSLGGSLLLLATIIIWNVGVSWSRVYLGVHSPCDVLGGWTIGVFVLFIFGGFSDKLYDIYELSSNGDMAFFVYFFSAILLALWVHPRSWPETQSYGEVICVLSGTATIWCGRVLHLGGELPLKSLYETNPNAALYMYPLRFVTGVAVILIVRLIVKAISKLIISSIYNWMNLQYYSYSAYCKTMGNLQPTKRFTTNMRFKRIHGEKVINLDDVPYDLDLPVKFVVYSAVGFFVSEGCPALFQAMSI